MTKIYFVIASFVVYKRILFFYFLMNLFMETINGYGTEDTETIKSKVTNWIASQSRYIKGLFQNLCWES